MSSIIRSPNVVLCQVQPGFYRHTRKGVVLQTVPCLFIIPVHISDLTPLPTSPTRPQIQPISLLDEPKESPATL